MEVFSELKCMNLTEQVLIREVKEGTPSTSRPLNKHQSESLTIR